MANKIKRCPFCGGTAKVYKKKTLLLNDETKDCYQVYCTDCKCSSPYEATEQIAIEVWNKRKLTTGDILVMSSAYPERKTKGPNGKMFPLHELTQTDTVVNGRMLVKHCGKNAGWLPVVIAELLIENEAEGE